MVFLSFSGPPGEKAAFAAVSGPQGLPPKIDLSRRKASLCRMISIKKAPAASYGGDGCLSRERAVYLLSPRKKRARVPGPAWPPMTGPISLMTNLCTPSFSRIMAARVSASLRQSPWLM